MHLMETIKGGPKGSIQQHGLIKTATEARPYGPGFTEEEAEKADTLKILGSDFADVGPDFCEFRLIKDDEVIQTKQLKGY